jgi:hypothetical protein
MTDDGLCVGNQPNCQAMNPNMDTSFGISVLEPAVNQGYLPKPIPTERDNEILQVLVSCIADNSVARFKQSFNPGHASVLQAYAERMASIAVCNRKPETLRMGLFALLPGNRADRPGSGAGVPKLVASKPSFKIRTPLVQAPLQ